MADETIEVTMTVRVSVTAAQAEGYRDAYGVAFVGPEIANRLRPEAEDALMGIRWLREHSTVTISAPQIEMTVTERQADGR